MARYIDANLIRYKDLPFSTNDKVGVYVGYSSKSEIDEIPTADVAEVKHGEWECVNIDYDVRYNMVTMRCPICEKWHSEAYYHGNPTENINYCPHCGAKMDEKECVMPRYIDGEKEVEVIGNIYDQEIIITERERLIELLLQSKCQPKEAVYILADYLLDHGVTVPHCFVNCEFATKDDGEPNNECHCTLTWKKCNAYTCEFAHKSNESGESRESKGE